MLFETSCTFFALLVKTVSRQEPKNIRFCISMLLLTPSGVILRSFGAPWGAMGPCSALCFYLLRGKVKQYYMFLLVLLASTFGAQRRNANLSYAAPLFALACYADIHAVIFWLQPT